MQDQRKPGRKSWWIAGGIVALVLLGTFLARVAAERCWSRYWHLMQNGAHCEAVIVRVAPGERCFVEYSFSLGGRNYLGSGSNCNLTVGQKATVTYLLDDPSHSCLGRAGETLADEVVSYLFGGLSFAPLS